MASTDIKVSGLPSTSVAVDTDVFYIIENNISKKITFADLRALMVYPYFFTKVSEFTVTSDAYQEIGRLALSEQPAGTYEYKLSMITSLNSTISSMFFRFSIDNGVTWTAIGYEPKDNTDKRAECYLFPITQAAAFTPVIIVQAYKENIADVMIVHNLDIILERKY